MDKKAKIIATIGPACSDVDTLERMIASGMDVARINASHTAPEDIKTEVERLRKAASRNGREVAILLDLMGPKIRVGEMKEGGAELVEGQEFTLTASKVKGDESRASITDPGIPGLLHAGDAVLLDDGAIRLEVTASSRGEVMCRVKTGGNLKSHKGLNLPGARLDLPSFTPKDREDLELGLELGIDWVALSFVRTRDNLSELRELLRSKGSEVPLMAKIEKPEAVSEINDIVDECDAVMVARGDLGVEMPLEEIPMLQKKIIDVAVRHGKPAVTATQMLESMIHNSTPTRAEVTDVANAVLDGSDAVMLSGETAVGENPVLAVEMMKRIILRAEDMLPYQRWLEERRKLVGKGMVEAVCFAACELALQTGSQVIVAPTDSGFTARQVSRFRPRQAILAPTPNRSVARSLALYWGIYPRKLGMHGTAEEMFDAAGKVAEEEGMLPKGGVAVIIVGMKDPLEERIPTTNTIRCMVGR
jgi:pyruvate kinase